MSKRKRHALADSAAESTKSGAPTVPNKVIHSLTDLGNATLFAEIFKDQVRFVLELEEWLVWTHGKWVKSEIDLRRLVNEFIAARRAEVAYPGDLITIFGDAVAKPEALKWVYKSQSKSRIDAMLEMAKADARICISQDALDRNHFLVGVLNGTLDLKTGQVRQSRPEDLITQYIAVKYDPQASCSGWVSFINQVSCGRQDLADYIQEISGYSLSGSIQEQKMFVMTGKGANGKSTFIEVFQDMLGDYAKTTPAHSLMRSESRAIRNDIARLRGARFVPAVEINSGKQLDEAQVKRLTGGDKITARFIGQEYFEFTPQAKFFLAVNTLPEVSGADDGIYRRMRFIPFDMSIADDKINNTLPDQLKAEKTGILAWAVEGFKRWNKNGKLSEPKCVQEASRDFRSIMDTIGSFIEDRCERHPDKRIPKGTLYSEYLKWARKACVEPVTMKKFGTLIGQQGIKHSKSGDTRFWQGISCLTHFQQAQSISPVTTPQDSSGTAVQ